MNHSEIVSFLWGVADLIRDTFKRAKPEVQESLERLTAWAESLEAEGLVKLDTYHGTANRWTLLPRFRDEGVGMVTIWHDASGASIQFW